MYAFLCVLVAEYMQLFVCVCDFEKRGAREREDKK